jgi:hypothetical protein
MPPVWAACMVAPPLLKRAAVIRGEGGAVRHAGVDSHCGGAGQFGSPGSIT